MSGDPGYFGPSSIMWKVNKEITVLFGGARALLMHAAHPLIAAGARQTSFYQRDPWKRLIRTLSLQNSVTFIFSCFLNMSISPYRYKIL